METLERLVRRIDAVHDLHAIVRTMKALSAVSIRQYERAALALGEYHRTVTFGLSIVLRSRPPAPAIEAPAKGPLTVIVFGSDHGLCGRFNEIVAAEAERVMAAEPGPVHCFAVGVQPARRLEAMGRRLDDALYTASTASGLTATAQALLLRLDARRGDGDDLRVVIVHNRRGRATPAEPHRVPLLPISERWLAELAARRWPTRVVPSVTMDVDAAFAALVREHLFVTLFRAGAEALASEHAARLAAMQAAERNIDERTEALEGAYRRLRQATITAELLDVVAGAEVLGAGEAL